jgi:hypothetical protein
MNDSIPEPRSIHTDPQDPQDDRTVPTLLESMSGAAAGALAGAIAGPAGMGAGAVLGSLVALVAGEVAHEDAAFRRAHDAELDREIGVTDGDLGAAHEGAEPGRGAFSAACMGIHGHGRAPAEGMIPGTDEE